MSRSTTWTGLHRQYNEAPDLGAVAKSMEKFGTRTVAVTGNIGDQAAVRRMAKEIEAKLGPVNILVNCAGGDIGAQGGKPNPNNALDISLEDIQVLTNNNLIGTMLVCQTFCAGMKERKEGSVINIASAAAHMGCTPEVVYSTLKAAVVHYTRCLALELRPFGVRINAVSPGATKTARFVATRTVDPAKMDAPGSLMRYAEPAEIADAVASSPARTAASSMARCCASTAGSRYSPGRHNSEVLDAGHLVRVAAHEAQPMSSRDCRDRAVPAAGRYCRGGTAVIPALRQVSALTGRPGSRYQIPTPALVVDLDALDRNIARMASRAATAGIALRPHAKTHKSAFIADRQIAAGAVGICCAKLGEAEALASAGVRGLLVTSPVVGSSAAARAVELFRSTRI
jgi:3-oxoacyl-[acyl-carrier protein] reductase